MLFIGFIITPLSSQIDPLLISHLEEGLENLELEFNPVGYSVAIQKGEHQWSSAIGISAVDDSMTVDHILAIGSITKTFTAACILSLEEEGALSLEDPIHLYLDAFDHIDSTISIKQLLNHTSGIFNYTEHPDFVEDVLFGPSQNSILTPLDVINTFVLEPVFEKGEKQLYSNTNYVLLGMVISKISGQAYYQEIFDRFDVDSKYPSMSVPPFNSNVMELADLWVDLGNGLQNIEEIGMDLTGEFSAAGAAGAFVSTPQDLAKWGYDLYTGKIINSESLDAMLTIFEDENAGFPYGLGVIVEESECGLTFQGHSGNILYAATMSYIPELDLSIAFMTNHVESSPLANFQAPFDILCEYIMLTNIEDPSDDTNLIELSPNPVVDNLSLSIDSDLQDFQVEILSMNGEVVYLGDVKSNIVNIDLSEVLSSGSYVIRLYNDDLICTEKFVKL